MSLTNWWWCSRGDHPTDDPHTDPETGDDVCPEHCATCHPHLAVEWEIDLQVTADDLRLAPDGTNTGLRDDDGRVLIAGHGSPTQDQLARASVTNGGGVA